MRLSIHASVQDIADDNRNNAVSPQHNSLDWNSPRAMLPTQLFNRSTPCTVSAIAATGLSLLLGLTLAACAPQSSSPEPAAETPPPSDATPATIASSPDNVATVTIVETTTQSPDSHTFAVTISSPDTGCDQYADWWEVITPEGDLLYRRILAHSHVDEQPFERTGGPVNVAPDQTVIVRAHMHPSGYGPQAMQGSITDGFETVTLPINFALALAEEEPLPGDCAF